MRKIYTEISDETAAAIDELSNRTGIRKQNLYPRIIDKFVERMKNGKNDLGLIEMV